MIQDEAGEGGEPEFLRFAARLEPLVRQIGHGRTVAPLSSFLAVRSIIGVALTAESEYS
jgi:hypothetical protein